MYDTSEQTAFAFLTSSAADSPVKTSPLREPGAGSTGSGRGFGSSSPESFVIFDRASSSWRTSPLSEGEVSESYSGTWPRAGTMRRGIACPQPPSAPLTAVTGSSWSRGEYPTPSATPYGTSQNEGSIKHDRPATRGTPSLSTWARVGGPGTEPRGPAWPTPTASEGRPKGRAQRGKNAQGGASLGESVRAWSTPTASMQTLGDLEQARFAGTDPRRPSYQAAKAAWATPQAHDGTSGGRSSASATSGKGGGRCLSREARLWPTPTSGDKARTGSRVGSSSTEAHTGTSLTDATCRAGLPHQPICPHGDACPGVLNPRFVLWLMGFPRTWFDPLLERPETLWLFPSEK
jgi:hypothetical protein